MSAFLPVYNIKPLNNTLILLVKNGKIGDWLRAALPLKILFAKKETLDNSIFYRPIQKTAGFIYPSIEKWYDDLKKK